MIICKPLFFNIPILLVFSIFLTGLLHAQDSIPIPDEPIKISRIKSPVRLDGKSEEDAWTGINTFPVKMIQPDFGNVPTERTEFLLCFDNDYLYAAGRFYNNDPSDIQVTSFKRDNWQYSTDFMAILLDTFNDNENGVMFLASPAGTRTDINILNDFENDANTSWNTFWDVATFRNNEGWFTEMRIPFSSLRFEEKDGKVMMGLSLHRWFASKSEVYSFPLTAESFGYGGVYKPSQTTDILFEGIKSRNPLYITPYLLTGLSQAYEINNEGTDYRRSDDFMMEGGLDVKIGLLKNLTLDVTVNPDFAQVEADDQRINLTRYSLFQPEKRLFFQERAGNFDFAFEGSDNLFYSRQIGIHNNDKVRIYGGARIVGRAGPWDIGFLNMQTQKHEDLPSENFNVIRIRRQVFNQYSYIGGMVTSRIGNTDIWNTVYGVDGIFRLFGNDYLSTKFAQSFGNDKSNEMFDTKPSKIYINLNRRGYKGLGYNLSFTRSGKDFNPGIGFERIDNYSRFSEKIQYGWFPGESSILQNHQIFIDGVTYINNSDGNLESSYYGPGWQFITKSNTSGSVQFNRYDERVRMPFSISQEADIPAGEYTFYGIEGSYDLLRGNPYRIGTQISAGSFYDGWRTSWSLMPVAYISSHIQLEGMYQLNRVEFNGRSQTFTGHIGRLKAETFLNVKHSLIAFIQYNSANDAIFSNFRYRFNPGEGHDLYLVYDEGLNTDREREFPILPRTKNRTIMLKYNYTFNIRM